MAKTVFVPGSVVSSAFLNAINNPIFAAAPDNDGEISLITNNDLSNAAGQIKPEWTTFRDSLRVSPGAGLSVNYTGGAVERADGTTNTIAPGSIAIPDNATRFVFITDTGAIALSVNPPLLGLILARVTTVAGAISGAIEDLRPRFVVHPLASVTKILGGTGGAGDFTANNGTPAFEDGLYYFRNFTVPAGVALNVSRYARIFCSGDVNIAGSIVVSPALRGGSGASSLSLFANFYQISTLGTGIGQGLYAAGGNSYNYAISPIGSAGASGSVLMPSSGTGTGVIGGGGSAGGGLWIEAGGTITISGFIQADGEAAESGSGTGTFRIAGAGGGSGGSIILISARQVILTAAGGLAVRGGNGSAGITSAGGGAAGGGGGGGGGSIVAFSPIAPSIQGNVFLSGGNGGANSAGANPAISGGGGGGNGGAGGNSGAGSSGAQNGAIGRLLTRTLIPLGG